jgi:hypothetical protein
VTAALAAGAANWLLLRSHIRRLAASGQAGDAAEPAAEADVGEPVPAGVDETDNIGGHRRYYDPWAAEKD